ncbi:hypothetical protein GCK72_007712 [Caenorhabditis remanei]|uniref:DUF281 domain-containing protein n=1 Tax=Caenorhabditis remanei TaxID=31234 RepID=A0A6A5HN18_CAERE|nr:hypothetical protein GCK72_007712 [Caenorhabditis remanei]KAF1767753.1 hypothetical protein GCK72_007712 [Caenorhabditis remanei]
MNWFSFFLLIILFQEGFCCLKIRPTVQCTCPDFQGLVLPGGNPSIIDEGGCDRKMICGKHFYTSVLFKFNETEIARPNDVEVYADHWLRSTLDLGQNLESGPAIDFFDYFGIICENSTWYATKAPLGFEYTSIEGKWKGSGNGGELEGKKTKVDSFSCHPPGSAQCTCPDIRELVDPRDETTVTSMDIGLVPITMKDGCVTSITCGTHVWTWIRTYYNESEITPPDDIDVEPFYANIDAVATGKWNDPPGYSIDMFSYFGLICENNEWYATKYPVGIQYFAIDDIKRFGENGELDGKKSKVKKIFCMLPGDAPTLPPVTTPAVENTPPQPQCTCPDFRELMYPDLRLGGDNVSIIDEGGCDRKIICGNHISTAVLFRFNETEISPPSNIYSGLNENDQWLRTITTINFSAKPGPAIDFFDYFGIICENNIWYATKAPLGFQYNTIEGNREGSGNAGELEGKKTKIDLFYCLPPTLPACTCPDIRELVDPRDETTVTSMAIDTVPFTMKDGCVTSITCGTHVWTWIRTYYNESEITPPDDIYEYDASDYVNIDAVATGKWNDPPGYSIDMFSYFGLICENNEWYATKYPVGIEYFAIDGIKRFGENGELDGKKSKVKKIFCMLPGEAPTLPPVTTPVAGNLCDKCEIQPILVNPENGMDLKPSSLTEIGQDGCVLTYLRCTIENTICISMQVYAKTATETVAIGNDDTIVSDATITCQPNGKYGFGTTKDIESVYCVYEGCM